MWLTKLSHLSQVYIIHWNDILLPPFSAIFIYLYIYFYLPPQDILSLLSFILSYTQLYKCSEILFLLWTSTINQNGFNIITELLRWVKSFTILWYMLVSSAYILWKTETIQARKVLTLSSIVVVGVLIRSAIASLCAGFESYTDECAA